MIRYNLHPLLLIAALFPACLNAAVIEYNVVFDTVSASFFPGAAGSGTHSHP